MAPAGVGRARIMENNKINITENSLCIIGLEKSESNIKLIEEAKRVFGSVFFVPINEICIGLEKDFSIMYRNTNLLKFGAILPRVPRQYYSYAYQLLSLFPPETFMAIPPITFLLASERFFLLTILRKRNVNTLDLYLARSAKAACRILEEEKFPRVIRVPGGKTGVTVKSILEAKSVIDALGSLKQPILIEELVKGMVSLYVAEPEVIASVEKRTKEKDVVFAKGDLKGRKPTTELRELALEAARAIDAKVARIDISMGKAPKVVNVELNPGLIEPGRAAGANVPERVISHVHQSYKAHQEKPLLMKFFDDAKSVVRDVLKGKHML